MQTELNKKVKIKKEKIESPWTVAFKRLKKNKLALSGLFILLILVAIAIFGPMLYPHDHLTIDLLKTNQPPSAQHWLGTDGSGRDVLARLMYGGRYSLSIGIVAVGISIVIGTTLGILAGYYGGFIDSLIMRIVDVFMCFPFLSLLIMVSAIMSDLKIPPEYRIFVVMFIIGALSWTSTCRMVRGMVLSLREQEFMQAAEALGLSDARKMFLHLLPNTLAVIIVSATLGIGGAILTESSLSFLGLGVTPPTPTWGNMIQTAQDYYTLTNRWWLWIPPGICIFLTVISINIFGDGLRDALDPKLKV
ncbi:oligopeptide ABC transporter permease [Clostridium sp. LIBA-8841]|uniref:oligopeptide ABC transporter permease n=1 Tax=Clostridium sp. LIBA-8841 TaxID=2987530 RepID=UPI002AC3766E|nr:oligopeptide ABC transporter permease [Clostridium sp. LIBA-8841]MDZ5255078.1 ABC transporter permease [Clostridium sp. LIBA-8841]